MAAHDRKRRLMTGATGFVGSHFALRCQREEGELIALTRAPSDAAARGRVGDALSVAARSLGENFAPELAPAVLAAELAQPDCGLGAAGIARVRQAAPEEFWHFAASLRYEDKHRDQIFASNLQGTRHALALARLTGCQTFVYVSTAYTAGRKRGPIAEQLHDGTAGFNNAYEESKARAEHAVAEFCTREKLNFAILRPSIVIGPATTKSTGGSTTGLYGFLRELCRIAAALRALGRKVEFRGDPRALCNLIPVDWFVDDVFALLDEGLERDGIYHNTCERPLTIAEVGQVVANALDVPGFAVVERVARGSSLEERLARRTAFYGNYLANSKAFLRKRPCPRELGASELADYVRGFLREQAALAPADRGAALTA